MKKLTYLSFSIALCTGAHAFTVLTEGHTDVGFGYISPKTFEPHIHVHDTDEEFEPSQALFFLGANTRDTRPVGNEYNFLGVSAGETYWRLPESEASGALFLGLGLEEIASNEPDFAPYFETDSRVNTATAQRWVSISVLAKRGPGEVAGFNFGDSEPVVWYSSVDGLGLSDKIIAPAGGHKHLNWAFSALGLYELDLQASTYFDENGNGELDASDTLFRSDVATYSFGVEAVPEPATMTAMAVGLVALVRKRRSK